jgi:hypothetical protein
MPADSATAEARLAAGAPVEALVPTDVGGLRAAVEVPRSSAAVLETGGAALSRIEVTHWRGDASMAFADRIAVEPGRWRSASDALPRGLRPWSATPTTSGRLGRRPARRCRFTSSTARR